MVLVHKLLENKDKIIWQIGQNDTVFSAIGMMDEKNIGALAVTEGGHLIGIVSERDYARKVILKGRSSKETFVKDIMTTDVIYAYPEQPIQDCMIMMTEHKIRHMPVLDGRALVGMITLGDVVKAIIKEQKLQIEHLEQTLRWSESY